jgi:hypothetical protein
MNWPMGELRVRGSALPTAILIKRKRVRNGTDIK